MVFLMACLPPAVKLGRESTDIIGFLDVSDLNPDGKWSCLRLDLRAGVRLSMVTPL